jgi:hypothetical protein
MADSSRNCGKAGILEKQRRHHKQRFAGLTLTGAMAEPYSPAAMIGRNATIFSVLLLLAQPLVGVRADDSAPPLPQRIVVLRNGEVLEGQISQQDDRYVVTIENGEIRLPMRDVDFLCQSLEEAYDVQSKRLTGQRIEDHLRLADWCLQHDLAGGAAQEITAAMAIDPNDLRVQVLDRRLQEMMKTPLENSSSDEQSPEGERNAGPNSNLAGSTAEKTAKPALPVNADELERLARNLPAGTVESYSTTILPLLLNHCSTAGCHGVGSQSAFLLLRPTPGTATARRLTLRDLHNTLAWVDHDNPVESKLLSTARKPHGQSTTPIFETEETLQYKQLVAWVLLATQGDKNSRTPATPAKVSMQRPTNGPILPTVNVLLNSSTASTGNTPAPANGTPLSRNISPAGAGWTNVIAPPGKTPPPNHTVLQPGHTPVNTAATTPPAAALKNGKPVVPFAAAPATVTDSNVKPDAATGP